MATQTFTPTATWHNTSRYQENGDISDSTIGAAETGEDAMDNLAYLTGGNSNSAVRRLATVADLAALKALTTQRDQDYFALDSNKRIYQYDSGSAATADDFSVVQPTSGGGRYILAANAVPKTTVIRRVLLAISMGLTDDGSSTGKDPANGRVTCNGGGTVTLTGQIEGLNAGDVITEVQLVANANVGGGGADVVATFRKVEADDGDTTPTLTTLATLTKAAGTSGEATSSGAPLPITIPEGPDADVIHVTVTCATGAPTSSYIYWVALLATRSYITE